MSTDAAGPSPRCFTEVTPEATIHFQVVDLGRQVYVWISSGAPNLSNLSFAIQSSAVSAAAVCNGRCVGGTRHADRHASVISMHAAAATAALRLCMHADADRMAMLGACRSMQAALPSVATLIPGSAASDVNSIAQRLGEHSHA